ncbi:MAG: insulinase family protein [Myxococcota bacterium]
MVGSDAALMRGAILKRHLGAIFDLLIESIVQPRFDDVEHRRLIEETAAQILSARDDDDTVADIFLRRALYKGHPLARSGSGELADLTTLTVQQIRHTYKRLFRRHQMLFAFAGDIDIGQAQRLIEPLLGELGDDPVPETALARFPEPAKTSIVIVDKPDRSQTQLRLARFACDGRDADALPLWLGALAFGGTFTSPLCQKCAMNGAGHTPLMLTTIGAASALHPF